ncbi:hypothetical protein T265_15427, partial [Opisthorchis viverrini]
VGAPRSITTFPALSVSYSVPSILVHLHPCILRNYMLSKLRGATLHSRLVLATCSNVSLGTHGLVATLSSVSQPGSTSSSIPPETTADSPNSSRWRGKNAWKLGFLGLTCSGLFGFGFAVALWVTPVLGYICRTWNSLTDFNQSIKDPISEKLLPDPVQPPYYQPPYTLVLELNGILVHPDWKFRTGWRFKKRPALELFLQQLSPYYEVTGSPVLMQLDPQGQYIHYRLFREATRYRNGKHIKDLSCLNRDLSRVILIDWDPNAASLQPRNALIVKKWQGDEADRELIDLAAFLRMLAMGNVEDIRLVLDFYRESDDPLGLFRERHEQLMEEQAKRKESEKASSKSPLPKFTFSGMSRS